MDRLALMNKLSIQIPPPQSPLSPVTSPTSPTSSYFLSPDGYETPLTSPEASPRKAKAPWQVDGSPDATSTGELGTLRSDALSSAASSRPGTPQSRRPSALLGHCERNASPRLRRLMTGDRFIGAPPNKDSFVLSKSTKPSKYPTEADPFAPSPHRSLRMAEQHATIRSPAPAVRPTGRAGTGVNQLSDAARRRAVSEGAIWTVGGSMVTEGVASTPTGRGGRITSGTTAPHYTADFLRRASTSEEERKHGKRLALAMDIDQGARMLSPSSPSTAAGDDGLGSPIRSRVWRDGGWDSNGPVSPSKPSKKKQKDIPTIPFRVLNAPALRDDYYCSLLAYSLTVNCLAVGLGPHVYLWSEDRGSRDTNIPDSLTAPFAAHVTSISFSSTEGGSAILAIGRADGRITLWSPFDRDPRFDAEQPSPISCVCFRPNTVRRPSIREGSNVGLMVATEELLVGDEVGNIYYYSIEWPDQDSRDLWDWHGSMTLLAKISCHTQQVCGIAWSPDGSTWASGGNDNQLFLFETKKMLRPQRPAAQKATTAINRHRGTSDATVNVRRGSGGSSGPTSSVPGQSEVLLINTGAQKQIFALNAAVKAIAFAPWQPSLIACGGGSNDRCIHFFHTLSGAKLATIDCHAQVTSLVWSSKRKEVAATFGFAQPEHNYRVAVFSWPGCGMVVGIPWLSEERALYAVSYPRGPSGGYGKRERDTTGRVDAEGKRGYGNRTREEGCLVVATSDASIKFHEIWAEAERPSGGGRDGGLGLGMLGGSQILEGGCSADLLTREAIR